MSSIAIGYDKSQLRERMGIVQTQLLDRGFPVVEVLGLAFGKRKLTIPREDIEAELDIDIIEDIEVDLSRVNPSVFLVYDNGDTFEYTPLNGIPREEEEELFEFDITYFTDFLDIISAAEEVQREGDFYREVEKADITVADSFKHSDHPSFDRFGFAFFHDVHMQTFFSEFEDQPLLLSGAIVHFGKGLLYYHPAESFSLKIDIAGLPLSVATGFNDRIVSLNSQIGGLTIVIENNPILSDLISHVNTFQSHAGDILDTIRIVVDSDPISNAIEDANSVKTAVLAIFINPGIIESITSSINNVVAQINLLPESTIRSQATQVVALANEMALSTINIALEATKAAEIAASKALRADSSESRQLEVKLLMYEHNGNDGLINLKIKLVSAITDNFAEGRFEISEVRRAARSRAAPIETTEIGEPATVVGPPCPPHWIPD